MSQNSSLIGIKGQLSEKPVRQLALDGDVGDYVEPT